MACEIVKQWVGNMDNTYDYCRTHKVESKDCPKSPWAQLELVSDVMKTPEKECPHLYTVTRYGGVSSGGFSSITCCGCGATLLQ